MIRIIYENKNENENKADITVYVGLDAYDDGVKIDNIRDNDIATKLCEDFFADVPSMLNGTVEDGLNETLGYKSGIDMKTIDEEEQDDTKLITSLTFDDGCKLLDDNEVQINGKIAFYNQVDNFTIDKIEKILGGKKGLISYELPNDIYEAEGIELLVNPSYKIKVIIKN